ncbi:MAG: Kae1-associated serine/threonine protein kinase [Candidatus Aenigmarchaeota archaeon]|nr:Kae1-associated serine/threonine protein kinase [Candidatus Aenigmarchaeota archaeon]
MRKIIQRGAEAILYLEKGRLVKERISKGYRISDLDRKIRKQRTRSETKLMERSRGRGLPVPAVGTDGDFRMVMDYIEGRKLKDVLNRMGKRERDMICEKIGEIIAKLHSSGIIHGDLTTSNMILKGNEIFLIDFGLGKFSEKTEDQAVDLFLLYEALKSTHFRSLSECWKKILKAYGKNHADSKEVLKRIEKIKKRRRYKGD